MGPPEFMTIHNHTGTVSVEETRGIKDHLQVQRRRQVLVNPLALGSLLSSWTVQRNGHRMALCHQNKPEPSAG